MRNPLFSRLRQLSGTIFHRQISVLALAVISSTLVFQTTAIASSEEAEGTEKIEQRTTEQSSSGIEQLTGDEIEPSTIRYVTIPLAELAILVKPMTLGEVQIEAQGWFLLLKHVAFRVSQTEVAIRLENRATQELSEGQKLLEESQIQLERAERELLEAEPNSVEYRTAIEEQRLAKDKLFSAKRAIVSALRTIGKFQSDPWLKVETDRAKLAEAIATVRGVYEKTVAERAITPKNSPEYEELNEVILFFEKSFVTLETLEEELQDQIPESSDYETLALEIRGLQSKLIRRAHILSASGLVPLQQERSYFRTASATFRLRALGRIEKDIRELEDLIRQQQLSQGTLGEEIGDRLEKIIEELEEVAFSQKDLKNRLLANSIALKEEEVRVIDRFEVILDALDNKGGESQTYRLYIDTVSRLEFDIFDTEAFRIRLLSWLKSEEGGQRLSLNLLRFIGLLAATLVASHLLAKATEHFLDNIGGISALLKEFAIFVVKRGVIVVGLMIALTSLGVSLGPVLALFGGVSFVLAFALQSNLGNFASGLMLLINKPFDVGDEIEIAGYNAFVEAISLANTKLRDSNGSVIILPNNTVWGGEITNFTNSERRRLSFKIFVKFDEDIENIRKMWFEVAAEHPDILDTPPPSISSPTNAQYQDSIRISLKAWCETPRYRKAYLSVLQVLQKKMKAAKIELVAPAQRVIVDNEPAREEYLLPGNIQTEQLLEKR